jgi:hypothetical protein
MRRALGLITAAAAGAAIALIATGLLSSADDSPRTVTELQRSVRVERPAPVTVYRNPPTPAPTSPGGAD